MAQQSVKPLTPQDVAVESLKQFEEALESLRSAFCLYAEFTDSSDPYDDHRQPKKGELRRTYKSKPDYNCKIYWLTVLIPPLTH